MADTLTKLGDKAKSYWSGLKSLPPDEGEAQAIKEKQANVDAVTAKPTPAPERNGSEPDPQGQYGSRPGEKRLDTSYTGQPSAIKAPAYDKGGEVSIVGGTNNNLRKLGAPVYDDGGDVDTVGKPYDDSKALSPLWEHNRRLNEASLSPVELSQYNFGRREAHMSPDTQKRLESAYGSKSPLIYGGEGLPKVKSPIPEELRTSAPVYDNGGEVKPQPVAKQEETKPGMKPIIHESMNVDTGKPSSALPPLVPEIKPTPLAPLVYDDGGQVDVNDGQHQVAVLKEGERVLTPEENEQYKKEHPETTGAPADFGGRVIPNPKNVQGEDSDAPHAPKPQVYPGGAKMNIDNAPLNSEESDKTFPTAMASEASVKSTARPYAEVEAEQKKAAEAKVNGDRGAQVGAAPTAGSVPNQFAEQPAEEKAKPTLGQSLAQDWLKKIGASPAPTTTQESTETQVQPREQAGLKPIVPQELHQEKAGGPLAAGPEPAPTGKAAYQAKMKAYDDAYMNAMHQAAQTNDPQYKEQAGRIREEQLAYQQQHPAGAPESAHPGILGKLGQVANDVAGRARNIGIDLGATPESEKVYGLAAKQAAAAQQVKEASAENAAENKPDKNANAGTLKEATQGGMQDPLHPELGYQQALYNDKTGKVEYKGPIAAKEGAANAPATPAALADVNTRIKNNPSLSDKQQDELQFPPNYKPTAADVKERLANVKDIEDAARQGKQDEFNNGIRKLTEENANLMVKAHLQEMEDKRQANEAKAAQSADVATAGLYTQENYRDAMKDWYKSGNWGKDSGLVTEIVNKEHSGQGAFGAATGGALVGSIFGPEGTAIGAGVGALTSLFAGPANGYLDTLKKEGISDEGYNAMQAYFNTLPARFAYEVGVQGLSATALRSSQLIQKVLNTVPQPNTPQDSFDNTFSQYYNPMKRLTEGKVKLTAPKGYVPPTKDELYPPKAKTEDNNAPGNAEHQKLIQSINLPGGGHPADAAQGPNGTTITWSGKAGDPWVDLATGKPVK